MRLAPCFASALALTLVAGVAAAQVHEPNGLQVPIDSSPEIQLYTLFQQRGENINWQTDAHTTPNAFSPLCGFTATYVLNQAGSHFGVAWYNETGQQPQPSDLHQLLPPNSPVGATFNGTAIKNDPAYMGGLVGFALVGGETHYTNSNYDTLCTACNPQGHWITALMYASTVTPNAYYICFEDGGTSASGWNNDGDFNDDVFFITGITCNGGGQPCDTGMPGICASGLTQCTANGTTCQQLNQPGPEKCNGIDDDCNGMVDDGPNLCNQGFVCDKGTCVQSCQGGEFQCPPNKVCSSDGYCVDPNCANVTCPSGQVCVAGKCKGPCDGVTCPYPQVCRVGACVDPCAGVMCGAGQVCDQGVCVTSCACQPCAMMGTACDMTSGQCVDPMCVGMACPSGQHCVTGTCVDDCKGAVCPSGQACMGGQCVMVQGGSGGASSSTGIIVGAGGSGASQGSGGSGGTSGTGASSGETSGSGGSGFVAKGLCSCLVVGDRGDAGMAWLAAAAVTVMASRRRRR
jgi:hypothetical protein